MTRKDNSAEGQSAGVTVTTGNSGGASGTAWDVVAGTSSGGTVQGYNSTVIHGTMSVRIASTGSSTQTPLVGWNDTANADGVIRWYMNFTSFPSANSSQFGVNLRGNSGVTSLARTNFNTTGTFFATCGASNSSNSAALSTGTLYRFEAIPSGFGTAGSALTVNCYSGESTSVLTSVSLSGQTTSFTTDNVRFGKFSGSFDVDCIFDSFAADIGNTAPIGPIPVSGVWLYGWDVKIG